MERIYRTLNVRAEDRRKLLMMAPVFFLCGIAEMMNYNGFMTLFNQRFGSEFLPYVYAVEAVVLPLEAWFMSWLTNRMSKPQLMRTLYGLMGAITAINALVLLSFYMLEIDFRFFYPFLFISSSFVVRQQTILLWSLAVDLCPTQQVKRLMPLFVSAATLGGVAAGLLVQLINRLFVADFVYILSPLLLLAGWFNYRKAIAVYLVPLTLSMESRQNRDAVRRVNSTGQLVEGSGQEGQHGQEGGLSSLDYFKRSLRSPFMLCAIGLMTLMPALYFLMEYEFLNTARGHYPTEEAFGAFFGLITTLLFTAAFLLQLLATRLMSWLGPSNLLVVISGVFLLAFVAVALLLDSPWAIYAVSASYMFVYLLLYYFAEPSYQLFFKVLPMRQRDGYRYVSQGIAASAGIAAGAGLQFLHTGFDIGLTPLAVIGSCLAAALIALAWVGRQLYIRELIQGVQQLRSAGMELAASFEGFLSHSRTRQAIASMLEQPNDYGREVALDLIRRTEDDSYLPRLLELADDGSSRIRRASLKAMNLERADLPALAKVASFLNDPDPEVRTECVRLLARASHLKHQSFYFIRLQLLDAHPMVVAEAVKALYALESEQSYEACYEAVQRLLKEGGEGAIYMIRVISDLEMYSFLPDVEPLLSSEQQPAVKVAVIRCLGKLKHLPSIGGMMTLLPTSDPEVHRAITEAFILMGDKAVPLLQEALFYAHPKVWHTVMCALIELVNEETAEAALVPECVKRMELLLEERGMAVALAYRGWDDLAELTDLRLKEIHTLAFDAVWRLAARLNDEQVVQSIRQAIEDPDEETRESGLEILAEGAGDRKLSALLLQTLQKLEEPIIITSEAEANQLIQQGGASVDHWLCALAFSSYQRMEPKKMKEELKLFGMLDKVVFLKQVSFFSDLSIEELGHIAGIAEEVTFADQALLLQKDEINRDIYVIIEGSVELSSTAANGTEGTIGVLGPREVFGETSALDGSPSTVTAVALLGEVRTLALRGEDVARLIRLHPEISIGLLRASFARVRLLEALVIKMGQ